MNQPRAAGPFRRAGQSLRVLRDGRPGDRFLAYHRSRSGLRRRTARLAWCAAGGGMVLTGFLTYPVPGPPSTLMILLGAALLARGSGRAAGFLDRAEVRLRRIGRRGDAALLLLAALPAAPGVLN